MTKRRGRLSEDDLAFYEDNIAAADGILRRVLRLIPIVNLFVTDDDVRSAANHDLEDARRYASNIKSRNQRRLKEERARKRGK